jgi:hypothetical protein
MWKKVLFAVLVAGGAGTALVASRFRHAPLVHIQRGTFVALPPAIVIAEVSRLQNWVAWSSYGKHHSAIRGTYGGPASGPGASYYWSSSNRDVEGRLTITAAGPDSVELELELVSPKERLTDYTIKVAAEGSGTSLVWSATGDADEDFMGKALGTLQTRDKRMGSELEGDVAGLKNVLEARSNMEAYRVERSTTIAAPDLFVLAEIMDFREWSEWLPREKLDPDLKRVFSGSDAQPGSTYLWSGNDEVGSGRVSMISSSAERVVLEVEVEHPIDSVSDVVFTLVPEGAGIRLVWTMTGEKDASGTAFTLLGSSPEELGREMEAGLANLKALAEAGVPQPKSKRSKDAGPSAARKKPMLEIIVDSIVLRPAT